MVVWKEICTDSHIITMLMSILVNSITAIFLMALRNLNNKTSLLDQVLTYLPPYYVLSDLAELLNYTKGNEKGYFSTYILPSKQ